MLCDIITRRTIVCGVLISNAKGAHFTPVRRAGISATGVEISKLFAMQLAE